MARKSFKDNPAMRFISPPETPLDNHESGLAARPPEAEPSPPFRAGHKGHENTRINLAFSPDDFQYLQAIARQDGLSITEYLNRLISADRKTRVDELKRA